MIRKDSPHYASLERFALGAVICPEASDAKSDASSMRAYVLSHLKESDFESTHARALWKWVQDSVAKDKPLSIDLIPNALMQYAMNCIDRWDDTYGTEKNVASVCSQMSRISDVFLAYDKVKAFFHTLNTKDDVETIHVVHQLREIADGVAKQHPEVVEDVISMRDAAWGYLNTWGKLSPRMKYGIEQMDADVRGFRAPNVIVIAGRTNTGKSAIWIPAAIQNAKDGRRVLIVSTEMDRHAMTKRMLAHMSRVSLDNLNAIEDGDNEKAEMFSVEITKAYTALADLPITMNDKCRTIGEVDALCRQAESNGCPYSLVIVDYIQLMRPSQNYIGKHDIPMSLVSREMRELATAHNVAVIALSQLSRAAMTEGKEPELHHLAQSGSLENDADVVILMHRPDKEDSRKITINLAKNRHGGYARWTMDFYGDTMTYYPHR